MRIGLAHSDRKWDRLAHGDRKWDRLRWTMSLRGELVVLVGFGVEVAVEDRIVPGASSLKLQRNPIPILTFG